jgi:uncharacterized Rossmann fold enzyme
MKRIFTTEPAVWVGFLQAVVGVVVAFGDFTDTQSAAVLAAAATAGGLFVRSQVTPTSHIV